MPRISWLKQPLFYLYQSLRVLHDKCKDREKPQEHAQSWARPWAQPWNSLRPVPCTLPGVRGCRAAPQRRYR